MTRSDPQSDLISADSSFSARTLKDAVTLFNRDLRRLTSENLVTFYKAENTVSDEGIDEAYSSVESFRQENGLPAVLKDYFSVQILGGSQEVFINMVTSAGIELEFQNDLIDEDNEDRFPGDGNRTSFITSLAVLGVESAPPEVLEKLKNDSLLSEQVFIAPSTKHLIEPAPYQIADEDEKVRQNVQKTHDYIRALLR